MKRVQWNLATGSTRTSSPQLSVWESTPQRMKLRDCQRTVLPCSTGTFATPTLRARRQSGLYPLVDLKQRVTRCDTRAMASATSMNEVYGLNDEHWETSSLSFCVVGASGDLAKKKILPALFALYEQGMMPQSFKVFGYARSKMTHDEFRSLIESLVSTNGATKEKVDHFLSNCFYQPGQYDSVDDFNSLNALMAENETGFTKSNRIFYLSIPPHIFTTVAANASTAASSSSGWTRMIVEKPFGRDTESFKKLSKELYEHLEEDQIYRIDHYLGKELIEDLVVLRFANLVFEPLWSRDYIRSVQVIFSENFGTEGRGGYFDQYGIIRDVIQNHLLQIMALFAMEQPASLDSEDIRDEKVKVLKNMKTVGIDDVVLGQYKGHVSNGKTYPGYVDDDTVPPCSITPTFAACAVFIDNPRWDGIPFLLKAGKALHSRVAEIRVQFRHVPGNLYRNKLGIDLDRTTNELVIRIQPDEGIFLKVNNKIPGLGLSIDRTRLDLMYKSRYDAELPDAYERLILDCINGDRRLFIRADELEVAWEKFTPVLQEIERREIQPEFYPYGSRGPLGAHYLAAKYRVRWADLADDDDM